MQLRCFNTQVDQTANGKADEQPVIETKVINQLEDIFYTQEYEGHAALKGKMMKNRHTLRNADKMDMLHNT